MESMFCFQCEQTAGGKGCVNKSGVCGKKDDTANLQDNLIEALVDLARALEGVEADEVAQNAVVDGLFTTITNVNFFNDTLRSFIANINRIKNKHTNCGECASPCNRYGSFSLNKEVWQAAEDIRSLKALILFGIKGSAAYIHHAHNLGFRDKSITDFFFEALRAIGSDMGIDQLLPLVLKVGEINLKCMELLDSANTKTYGSPTPVVVPLKVEKGPFIVISGHDLHDLYLLLQQTEGKGINIYTHSEMLPAHGYEKLRAFSHLKGNFGTAWQNQQKEFDAIPAPILFTTNCLMVPRDSYKDRVFTTSIVSYPQLKHIGVDKDFSPVIERALQLGGYESDKQFYGINGGESVSTGFAHETVLNSAQKIVSMVKSGQIKHFFLVGGCDGARTGRNYYTEFVKQTPKDSLILTLACGKYRFNDLNLGTIGGLPRIMDMGQCNDAFSAIRVAVELSEAFDCSINELPLSLVLSWYEQKAVAVLLTLLHLGIKNIFLGPSLPAFVSPAVFDILSKNFNLRPISEPKDDLEIILG